MAAPLERAEFARAMAAFAPFEVAPRLGCAVSGGPDSLALLILLDDWARECGGVVVALTVDHGLRPDSAAEARWVAALCADLKIAHRSLCWRGEKPRKAIQAAARDARYALLGAQCRRDGLLHLAVAHHREDQAETLLLRLAAGSGPLGLAGMSAIVEQPGLRLIRPLLDQPKARLTATLAARGLDWLEDPSNRRVEHKRVALRRVMPQLAAEGLDAAKLADLALQFGRLRGVVERAAADLLAEAASPDPAGFVWLDPGPLRAAPAPIALRALADLLQAVGGAAFAPRLERLARLHDRLCAGGFRGATLGGCRLLARRRGLLVVREAAAVETAPVETGAETLWDGRFAITIPSTPAARGPLSVGPLGASGWQELVNRAAELRRTPIPAAARLSLPAISDLDGLLFVPHFKYVRKRAGAKPVRCVWRPRHPLASTTFAISPPKGIKRAVDDGATGQLPRSHG
jgi:tRNA(Ile)-lysidine synthase